MVMLQLSNARNLDYYKKLIAAERFFGSNKCRFYTVLAIREALETWQGSGNNDIVAGLQGYCDWLGLQTKYEKHAAVAMDIPVLQPVVTNQNTSYTFFNNTRLQTRRLST